MAASLDKNDTLEEYYKKMLWKYRASSEGKQLKSFLRLVNKGVIELLAHYERTCNFYCGEHFDFQCRSHEEHTIASYHTHSYVHLGMEEVEQFVSFMSAYELKTFLDNIYEATSVTHICHYEFTIILDYSIDNFSDNIYVVDYNESNTKTK
jgi:hypothetical protein